MQEIQRSQEPGMLASWLYYDFDPILVQPTWPDEERLWILENQPWIIITLESAGNSAYQFGIISRLDPESAWIGKRSLTHTLFPEADRMPVYSSPGASLFHRAVGTRAVIADFSPEFPLDGFILIGDAGGPSGPAFVIP